MLGSSCCFPGRHGRSPERNVQSLHVHMLPTQPAWARGAPCFPTTKGAPLPRPHGCPRQGGPGGGDRVPGALQFGAAGKDVGCGVSIDPGACGIWRRDMGLCPVSRLHCTQHSVPRLVQMRTVAVTCCWCLGPAVWPSREDAPFSVLAGAFAGRPWAGLEAQSGERGELRKQLCPLPGAVRGIQPICRGSPRTGSRGSWEVAGGL